jgi:signal peptidase II
VATTEAQVRSGSRAAAFARAAVVLAVVLVADQVSKAIVRSDIAIGDVHKFLPGINLVDVRNTGVAFSLFAGGGALVLACTLIALGLLLGYFAMRPDRPLLWLPAGMLTGGAIGNLVDRVAHGGVTDFIKLPFWPAFNVADMSITFGVLALLYVLEGGRRDGG